MTMAGTAVTGWPKALVADASHDPDFLPGDAAHAWLREVYNVVWGANDSTPTNAARIYCYLSGVPLCCFVAKVSVGFCFGRCSQQ
jgi:hypothetical protein